MIAADALAQIHFRDDQLAARNLAEVKQRVPVVVYEALLTVLRDAPDPDSALNLFDRMVADSEPRDVR